MVYTNIYGYGCSHTVGTTNSISNIPYLSHLATKLKIENIFNRGKNSTGNKFNRAKLITDYLNGNIKKNSFIIFQLSFYQRNSFELVHQSDIDKFIHESLDGYWGTTRGIVHTLTGMFNKGDEFSDNSLHNFVNTYYERLSGDAYIMYDDIFSTYSILKLISSEIENVNFLMISWPEIKVPFDRCLPLEFSNISNWSHENKLTENDEKNNKDYHLSQIGHEILADKIFKYLNK